MNGVLVDWFGLGTGLVPRSQEIFPIASYSGSIGLVCNTYHPLNRHMMHGSPSRIVCCWLLDLVFQDHLYGATVLFFSWFGAIGWRREMGRTAGGVGWGI